MISSAPRPPSNKPRESIQWPDHDPFDHPGAKCGELADYSRPVHGAPRELVPMPADGPPMGCHPAFQVGQLTGVVLLPTETGPWSP